MRTITATIKTINRTTEPNRWFNGFKGMFKGIYHFYKNRQDVDLPAYVTWWVYVSITGKELNANNK